MNIRRAEIKDAERISQIICDTIRFINSKDYGPEQLKVWLDKNDISSTRDKLERGRTFFVLIENEKIVGVGALDIEKNKLTGLYVDYKIQSKGIGSQLLEYIENYSREKGIKKLEMDSTITAQSFYEKKNYKTLKEVNVEMDGIPITCVLMEKFLQ